MSASASKATGYVMTLLGVLAISFACAARAAAFEECAGLLVIRCNVACDLGCKDHSAGNCAQGLCSSSQTRNCRNAAGPGDSPIRCKGSKCEVDNIGDPAKCWCYK